MLFLFSLATGGLLGGMFGEYVGHLRAGGSRGPQSQNLPQAQGLNHGCLAAAFLCLVLPCIAYVRQLTTNGYDLSIKLIVGIAGVIPFIIVFLVCASNPIPTTKSGSLPMTDGSSEDNQHSGG